MKKPPMPALLSLPALLAALSVWMAIPGCRVPPVRGPNGLIDCSIQAVKDQGIKLVPSVNTCLVDRDASSCLLGLINPAAGITTEILACVTRSAGASFAAQAQVNPADTVSEQAAQNARKFIIEQDYQFKD